MDPFSAKSSYMGFVKSKTVLYNPEGGKVRVTLGKNDRPEETPPEVAQVKTIEEKPKKKVHFSEDVPQPTNTNASFSLAAELENDFIDSDDDPAPQLIPTSNQADMEEEDDGAAFEQEIQKRKKNFDFKRKALNRKEEQVTDYDLPMNFSRIARKDPAAPDADKSEKPTRESQHKQAQAEEIYGKGYKILESLGHKIGKGLGKESQGILKPLEAVRRTMIGGDEAPEGKFKPRKAKKSKIETLLDEVKVSLTSEEEDAGDDGEDDEQKPKGTKQVSRPEPRWRRSKAKFLRKTHEKLKAAEETIDAMAGRPITQQKIIDLRGPEAVSYENYTAFSDIGRPSAPAKNLTQAVLKPSYMGELQIVLRSALDKARFSLQNAERKISSHKDSIIAFKHEKQEKEEETAKVQAETEAMRKFATSITDLEEKFKDKTSEEILNLFEDLLIASPKLFSIYSMEKAFVARIAGKMKDEYIRLDFQHDEEMKDLVELLKEIRQFLLEVLTNQAEVKYADFFEDKAMFKSSKLNLYDEEQLDELFGEIIENALFPTIRSYVVNVWKPETDDALVDFFDKNKELIPTKVRTLLFDTCLLPKLGKAVDAWDPLNDKMPIHFWIHPWLPVLGKEKLSTLWKPIQYKVSQALQQWEPADESALKLLSPWFNVFDEQTWENIVTRCILPKLAYFMKDLDIDPDSPNIDPIQWLLAWQHYIPIEHLTSLIEGYLIAQLKKQWEKWLQSGEVEKTEMMEWLRGWKDLLGSKILRLDPISRAFQQMERQV